MDPAARQLAIAGAAGRRENRIRETAVVADEAVELPALGQSLGKAIKGFKQGLNEIDAEAKQELHDRVHEEFR